MKLVVGKGGKGSGQRWKKRGGGGGGGEEGKRWEKKHLPMERKNPT